MDAKSSLTYLSGMRGAALLIFLHALAVRGQELHFQQITTADGLSDNAITCIFEDGAGYIWIGTERGLDRFDGQRVDQFPAGKGGPFGSHITSIAQDGIGRLWVGTADGGLSMRTPNGAFMHYGHDSTDARSLPPGGINHVLVLNDSTLLLSSRTYGAVWFRPGRGVLRNRGFRPALVAANGDTTVAAERNWCHNAYRLDDQRVWLSMVASTGSYIVDVRTGMELARLPSMDLTTNALRVGSNFFMGGWGPGVDRTHLAPPYDLRHLPIPYEVHAMVPWGDGLILGATKVDGLVLFDENGMVRGHFLHKRSDPASLQSNRVSCMLVDRAKNLWVGTANGVSVHAPRVWNCHAVQLVPGDHAGDLAFHHIQQDPGGKIRISTSKGFFLVDPEHPGSHLVELTYQGSPLEVTGLFKGSPGEWFAGTETGLFRYDLEHERLAPPTSTGTWTTFHPGSMYQVRAVTPVRADGRELLCVGALGYALAAIDGTTGTYVGAWNDMPMKEGHLMLRTALRDAHGTYWCATAGGVLSCVLKGIHEPVDHTFFNVEEEGPRHLPGNDAQDLVIQGDSVWVALRSSGAACIVDGKAHAWAPPPWMPQDALGVTTDKQGRAWFTTSNGLLCFNPRDSSWLHVPVNDGREFRQLTKCITTLADGRIAFCADDHLLLLDPADYDSLPPFPAARIVEVGNTDGILPIDADDRLKLPFRKSSFDVMLTALQPVHATPLTFICRLEGGGAGSQTATAHQPLRYTGVAPGKHRLLVRVRDAYGREGPEQVLLTVTVVGPFWQQWWFFALIIAATALGMYLISRLRHQHHMRLQGMRDRIARDLHDDIGSTLGSISFYSEALRRKLQGDGDGMTREVAEKIGTTSRQMIDRMSDIVWTVDPKNDHTGALLERLEAFAKDLLSTKEIVLHTAVSDNALDRKLTTEQRRNLFLICKEALHNTVKYANASEVTIKVGGTPRGLAISTADNGRGFEPANMDCYNGNGLSNMHKRASAMGARLSIASSPGKGTCITIDLDLQAPITRSGDGRSRKHG